MEQRVNCGWLASRILELLMPLAWTLPASIGRWGGARGVRHICTIVESNSAFFGMTILSLDIRLDQKEADLKVT